MLARAWRPVTRKNEFERDQTRRSFLTAVGHASLVYAFHFACSKKDEEPVSGVDDVLEADIHDAATEVRLDYREWLVVDLDGSVAAHTGRSELGQGLKTVLSNVICQGLELPESRVQLIMGDTELCPNDGPTTGSSSTRVVGWGYWLACERVRKDVLMLAARTLDCPEEELIYRQGEIFSTKDHAKRIGMGELGNGKVRLATVDTASPSQSGKHYQDNATLNVNAVAIVTGTQRYTGDVYPEDGLYGAFLLPPYHMHNTRLLSVDLSKAREIPDLVSIRHRRRRSVFALGRTYRSVQEALDTVGAQWKVPPRPRVFNNEQEIRSGAELVKVIEKRGNVEAGLERSQYVISETYITQYASQVPIETETAVAKVEGNRVTVWTGTQNPFLARERTARRLELPESQVRIIEMPVGGGFGAKAGPWTAAEAATLAQTAGVPVKYVYSRKEQFQRRGRYKESVLIDIASGVLPNGQLLARKIDIHQDTGKGTKEVYEASHVLTRLFKAPMPVRHSVMRGTSFVQTGYALESHTDVVAKTAGLDPVEFRKRNVVLPAFRPLLDACAEMIDFGTYQAPDDHGIGFAICNHGDRQLGAVAAEVSVDRPTGRVEVKRLCGAFDIGVIINVNTLIMGAKGAMIWGIGYALFEEVALNGHMAFTQSLNDYRISRFSAVPPIKVVFLDNQDPSSPRGCGELPVIPTIGAICNAVYDATSARFYTLPLTPERVKAALQS